MAIIGYSIIKLKIYILLIKKKKRLKRLKSNIKTIIIYY